jgi:hypothetical protein
LRVGQSCHAVNASSSGSRHPRRTTDCERNLTEIRVSQDRQDRRTSSTSRHTVCPHPWKQVERGSTLIYKFTHLSSRPFRVYSTYSQVPSLLDAPLGGHRHLGSDTGGLRRACRSAFIRTDQPACNQDGLANHSALSAVSSAQISANVLNDGGEDYPSD